MVAARAFALWAVLAAQPVESLPAQQADSTPSGNGERPLIAIAQTLATNVVVNRFDSWVLGEAWARPGPGTWSRNVRLGWEWDENNFGTNMFAHPYHGGLYFAAGRSNGLDFWESAPLAFLGSWTWEYFGETHRPSLNDFFMTSFGGIALGEMFHRIGASIRDNQARGTRRLVQDLVALPFDPVGGLHRLTRREWARRPNPPEHNPGAYLLRVHQGARFLATADPDSAVVVPGVVVDLRYGDPFVRGFRAPFDVFGVRAVASSSGGLNVLRAAGRLYGKDLNRPTSRHRHVFVVNQRFDYVDNPAQKIGGQSVEAGIISRWMLPRDFALRTQAFGDFVLLGAIDAPGAGFGERNYDFGPGAGLRLELGLERRGVTYIALYSQSEYVHAVSGATADHFVGFVGLEVSVPIAYGMGVAVHATHFSRLSRYSDRPDDTRDFPEVRLLLTWTAVGRPTGGAP